MRTGMDCSAWALAALLGGVVLLVCPASGRAQTEPPHSPGLMEQILGGDPHNKDRGESKVKTLAQPYNGQIYCPITGAKLGLDKEAVAVQTSLGAEKASRMGRLLGQKDKPGAVIYVSSSELAEQVRQDPQPYLAQIIRDKTMFPYTYAQAPPQRPAVAPALRDGRPEPFENAVTSKDAAVPAPGTSH